jgi:hypothetical protein
MFVREVEALVAQKRIRELAVELRVARRRRVG